MLANQNNPAVNLGRWTVQLRGAEMKRLHPVHRDASTQQLLMHPVILVLLEGKCRLKREKRTCRMRHDTVYICRPGTTFDVATDGSSALVAVLRIGLYDSAPDRGGCLHPLAVQEYRFLPEETVLTLASVKPADRCRTILGYLQSGNPLLECRAQWETTGLLLDALEAASTEEPLVSDPVERVRLYIDKHLEEQMTMDQLALMAGLSAKHFAEVFKKTYGQTAHEYITQARLDQAKRLMLQPGRRLKDVAHAIGYGDEFYFSRLFKKEHGLSPSQYILKRRSRIAGYACASSLGYLLSLDVLPVAAPMHPKWTGYYMERCGADILCHLSCGSPRDQDGSDLQLLAEASPELIVHPHYLGARERERLSAISKTFELPEERAGAWKTGLSNLAQLLDMKRDAERWIEHFERRTAHARNRIAGADGPPSVLFVRMVKDGLFGLGNEGILDYVYRELGLLRPAGAPEDGSEDAAVSLEQLAASDVDCLLMLVRQDSETLECWDRLRQTPEWKALPVVRERRLGMLSSSPWREYSPVSLHRIMEEMLSQFGENCPW